MTDMKIRETVKYLAQADTPLTKKCDSKSPVIRRGQRTLFRKATNAQVQERTEWLALKIAIQPTLKDGEICRMMRDRYGIKYRQTAEYVARAKRLLHDRSNLTKEQAKQVGVNALLDQIQNEKGSARTAALRLWTDIFGFAAPTRLNVGDPNNKPLAPAVVAPVVQFIIPDNRRGEVTTNGYMARNLRVR